jgi:photosystem II stability/assembly factor-like uncharacterized protein
VTAIVVTDQGTIIAGTESGVYRSTNRGLQWIESSTGMDRPPYVNVLVKNTLGDVFVGMGIAANGGMYRSSDEGVTWQACADPYGAPQDIRSLCINSHNEVLAVTQDGLVFRSSDKGNTWVFLSGPLPVLIAVDSTDNIYAGTVGSGVFKSTDNGSVWMPTAITGYGDGNYRVSSIAAGSNGFVCVGIDSGCLGGRFWYSSDNGLSWASTFFRWHRFLSLSIDMNDGIYAGTSRGLLYSSDCGATWSDLATPYNEVPSLSVFSRMGDTVLVGSEGAGVFLIDATSRAWAWSATGITATVVPALYPAPGGHIFASTRGGTVWRTSDRGETWQFMQYVTQVLCGQLVKCFAATLNGTILAGASEGVRRSTDNGRTWFESGLLFTNVNSFTILPNGHILAGTGGRNAYWRPRGVYRSTDDGVTWSVVGLQNTSVLSITVHGGGETYLAATMEDGFYRSTDHGTSWVQSGLSNAFVMSSALSATGRVFAGAEHPPPGAGARIWRSTNEGVSWQLANGQFSYPWVLSLAGNRRGDVFASLATMDGGVFRSTDDGQNWDTLWRAEENQDIFTLAVDEVDYLWAGTTWSGVFRTSNPTLGIDVNKGDVAKESELFQNYPNPFNPETRVRYSIRKRGFVSLKVYDVLGREISTLVSEEKQAGNYEVVFDAADLSSGVYLYRLLSGDVVQTRRLLLLK